MDPNAKLTRMRELAKMTEGRSLDEFRESDPLELVDEFKELDEWLSNGGFPPDAWVKNAHYNHPASTSTGPHLLEDKYFDNDNPHGVRG